MSKLLATRAHHGACLLTAHTEPSEYGEGWLLFVIEDATGVFGTRENVGARSAEKRVALAHQLGADMLRRIDEAAASVGAL